MEVLRTSDERFAHLQGYPFGPHYVEVERGDGSGTLRIHHLDEGSAGASETVLLMHGEPSWSYLYRHMIPTITSAGHRAVAPDLVGFGRSDKPSRRSDYTYQRHVDWMTEWFANIGLQEVTLVCQDWGGLIGLRLVAAMPERFRRLVVANTFLPTGDRDPGAAFRAWQQFSQDVDPFPVGRIVNGGCTTDLSERVIAAYDAPFLDESYKEGARQFPLLVPTTPDDPAAAPNREAWESLARFDRPVLCAFSDSDPIMAGADAPFRKRIPGAAGQPHTTIAGGGHFLQEDCGPELAAVVTSFIAGTAA
jgi:haloalkane dehalogenase